MNKTQLQEREKVQQRLFDLTQTKPKKGDIREQGETRGETIKGRGVEGEESLKEESKNYDYDLNIEKYLTDQLASFGCNPISEDGDKMRARAREKTKNFSWIEDVIENLNLDFTIPELRTAQNELVKTFSQSSPVKRAQLIKQVRTLADIYTNLTRQYIGRKTFVFHPRIPIVAQTKRFNQFLKLACLVNNLGLSSRVDFQQYIESFWTIKLRQIKFVSSNNFNLVPVNTLISPLGVLDYLKYYKEVWFERYKATNPDHVKELHNQHHNTDHYQRLFNGAFNIVEQVVDHHSSQFSVMVPELMINTDYTNLFLVRNKQFVGLVKTGAIRKDRPDLFQNLCKLNRQLTTDSRLKKTAIELQQAVDHELFRDLPRWDDTEDVDVIDDEFGYDQTLKRKVLRWYEACTRTNIRSSVSGTTVTAHDH